MPINPPITSSADEVPGKSARTSHAIKIKVAGQTIGLIQTWNPGQTRGVTPLFELNSDTSGDPVQTVPGNVGGQTISITRYDLYTERMEQAFRKPGGPVNAAMLSDFRAPFDVQEEVKHPDGTLEVWVYVGCWLTSVGRSHSATDGRLIMVNGQIAYTRKIQLA